VNSQIYRSLQQRFLNLLDEESLSANRRQGHIRNDITAGPNSHHLDSNLRIPLSDPLAHPFGLLQGKLASSRADS